MKDDLQQLMAKRNPKYNEFDVISHSNSSDDEGFGVTHQRMSRSNRLQKPVPPPRTRIPIPNGTNIYNNTNESVLSGYPSLQSNQFSYFSRAGSLDRKLADMKKLNFSELKRKNTGFAANEFHDYSDIYTPSQETQTFINNIPQVESDVRPPTPPLHRCPSWESRIYRIASSGFPSGGTSLTSTPTHSMRITSKKTNPFSNKLSPKTVLNEYNVPVFATVKGRASRIRSIPFTDDSTDSSDNEFDIRITTTTGTTSSSGRDINDLFDTLPLGLRRDDSQLSEDYALPPDAIISASMDVIALNDSREDLTVPKRFSSLQRQTSLRDQSNEIMEKSGYLTKLGGRLKTWRRRWFVLKDGVLRYYRSQSDANKNKVRAEIKLDNTCRISTTCDSGTFQLITGNNKKIYYLTADSVITLEEWIRVLNSVLKRNAVLNIVGEQKPIIEGFLTKVKLGHSKRCWAALYGRYFLYFKSPNDKIPINKIDIKSAKVEEVDNFSDSDNDETEENTNTSLIRTNSSRDQCEHTIALTPKHTLDPIYLLFSSKQELNEWLYHLTAASTGEHSAGTPFEHLVSRLMKAETDCADTLDGHSLWKSPLLLYTKDNISEPLTTLPNEYLRKEAINLFKSIQLFLSAPLDSSGIDYHVSLLQNSLQLCITNPELQSELFFQLVKQTSPHNCNKLCGGVHQFLLCATQTMFTCDTSGTSSEKTSPTSLNEAINNTDKSDSSNFLFIQSFQFLSLAISLFSPQSRTLWLLRHHLRRSSDPKTEFGKYAIYCQRALDRTLKNGPREFGPSRMEVLSILLRNPYHHSLPHSIPVNFVNQTYNVIGFDGSTTVREFCQSINEEIGIRDNSLSGFALFSDDPIDKEVEHLLDCESKVADVISRWERALRENLLGKFENTKVVKLIYKRRLFLTNSTKGETERERLLSVYHINSQMLLGRFPVTQELALELSALLAQIEFGDFVAISRSQIILEQVVDRFFPLHFKQLNSVHNLIESVRLKWVELKARSVVECVRIYLNCSRKWTLWNHQLFDAKLSKAVKLNDRFSPALSKLWIAVSYDSIALLDLDSFEVISRYLYKNLITFGGCKQDFMLVFSTKLGSNETDSGSGTGSGSSRNDSLQSERLLFVMNKSKIVEITLLIADYINSDSQLNAVSTLDTTHTIDSTTSGLFSRFSSIKFNSQTKL